MTWVCGSIAGIWTATSASCEFLELKALRTSGATIECLIPSLRMFFLNMGIFW